MGKTKKRIKSQNRLIGDSGQRMIQNTSLCSGFVPLRPINCCIMAAVDIQLRTIVTSYLTHYSLKMDLSASKLFVSSCNVTGSANYRFQLMTSSMERREVTDIVNFFLRHWWAWKGSIGTSCSCTRWTLMVPIEIWQPLPAAVAWGCRLDRVTIRWSNKGL